MCVLRAPLCVSVCVNLVCHSAKHWTCCWQATQSVDSPLGRAVLEAESGACHPNHQPPPPLSIISRPARSLLSLLSFSWAPEPGLWPVDECYILAVSTGVSWGLACGGSAVSGPVCQLLVPLPPAPQRTLQSVAQTRAGRAATDSHLWLENERIALRIGIFIAMPMKRGCLKPLSARVLCF